MNKTVIERKCVLRALTWICRALIRDVPDVFSGTVRIVETYIGGSWKNKRMSIRDTGIKRGTGTKKQPVSGIFCRNGLLRAEIVDKVESKTLQPLISSKEKKGSIVCSGTWRVYVGIASKGFIRRMINQDERECSDGEGNHIMDWRDSGDIRNEKLRRRAVFDEINQSGIWVSMCRDSITELRATN